MNTQSNSKLQVVEHNLPAYWASYLINNDGSGIGLDEKLIVDSWLKSQNLPFPVSCEPSGIGRFNGLQCDLETYSFLI